MSSPTRGPWLRFTRSPTTARLGLGIGPGTERRVKWQQSVVVIVITGILNICICLFVQDMSVLVEDNAFVSLGCRIMSSIMSVQQGKKRSTL